VAKLRDVKTDANLLLFQCSMGAGHFRVTGR
jgi:protease II